MRNVWSGVWCVVLSSVIACSGHGPTGDAGPDASAFSLGNAACPAIPGEAAPIAVGRLAGMDATRLFLDSGTGSWPKAGGSGAPFMTHGAGVHLTLNGSYFWNDVEHRAVVVTDASGTVVRTIPLASPSNSPIRLAPAGDAGVYVLTHCVACPATSTDTIELIPDAASNAQTVVTPEDSVQIHSIDAVGSVLIWTEQKANSEREQFKKRDATTGAIVSMETPSDAVQIGPGALLIVGDQFFAGMFAFGPSRIERRALADGALIDTVDLGLDYGYITWLAHDSDLYVLQTGFEVSLPFGGTHHILSGLFRIQSADHKVTQIGIDPAADPILIDGDVLYCTHIANDSPSLPPYQVSCYRQR